MEGFVDVPAMSQDFLLDLLMFLNYVLRFHGGILLVAWQVVITLSILIASEQKADSQDPSFFFRFVPLSV